MTKAAGALTGVYPSYESGRDDEFLLARLDLAEKLLLGVAGIDKSAFEELREAVKTSEGYANGLVDKMNEQLANALNFPKWGSQDSDFSLYLTLRDFDLVFTVRDRTGSDYSFGERSGGMSYFLSCFVQYLSHKSTGGREILLMDEPDAYLSMLGQQDLLAISSDFAAPADPDKVPVQVVYVIHSSFLIDKNHGERIRVLEKGDGDEGTRIVSNAARNHYEPLPSAFGAFVAETTFIGNCNLMLEGQADQVLLAGISSLARRLGSKDDTLDLNTLSLVPAGSAEHIPYMVYLARGRDVDTPAIAVLLDSDKEGQDIAAELRKGYRDRRLIDDEFVIGVGDLNAAALTLSTDTLQETEDLVPAEVAALAIKRFAEEVLAADDAAALAVNLAKIDPDPGRKLFKAAEVAAKAASPHAERPIRLDKVGFARAILDVVEHDASDELRTRTLDNFAVLFRRLDKAQRDAMRKNSRDGPARSSTGFGRTSSRTIQRPSRGAMWRSSSTPSSLNSSTPVQGPKQSVMPCDACALTSHFTRSPTLLSTTTTACLPGSKSSSTSRLERCRMISLDRRRVVMHVPVPPSVASRREIGSVPAHHRARRGEQRRDDRDHCQDRAYAQAGADPGDAGVRDRKRDVGMRAVHPAFESVMGRVEIETVPKGANVREAFTAGHSTSLSLARVLAAGCLARLDPAQTSASIWDPSVGEGFAGHLLTQALLSSGVQVQFRGQDIDGDSVAASRTRFEGLSDAQFALGDTLSGGEFEDFSADLVIVDAPWGMDWSISAPAVESRRRAGEFRFGLPQRGDGTWLFISLALEKLRRPEVGGGRVVALVNPGAVSRAGTNAELRRRVLDAGLLESVVRLPEGLAPNTSLPLYLLIFSNRVGETGRDKAMIADLQTQFTTEQRRRTMLDSAVRELESGLRTGRPGPRNRTVPIRTFIRREARVSRPARQGQQLEWRITTFRDTAIDAQLLEARYGPDSGVLIVGATSEAYDLDPGRPFGTTPQNF